MAGSERAEQKKETPGEEKVPASTPAPQARFSPVGFPTAAPNDEGDEGNAWVLTYIDVLTLLLTLFVILLAYAKYNEEQYEEVTQQASQTVAEAPASADEVAEGFRETLTDGGMGESVEVIPVAGRVELRIKESILFPSGSARLRIEGEQVLQRVAEMLSKGKGRIAVEGHTDNIPIATERFPSNWELSAARASNVVRNLIEEGIPAGRLKAVGYAATRPVADNTTATGRARNRRVSLVLDVKDD